MFRNVDLVASPPSQEQTIDWDFGSNGTFRSSAVLVTPAGGEQEFVVEDGRNASNAAPPLRSYCDLGMGAGNADRILNRWFCASSVRRSIVSARLANSSSCAYQNEFNPVDDGTSKGHPVFIRGRGVGTGWRARCFFKNLSSLFRHVVQDLNDDDSCPSCRTTSETHRRADESTCDGNAPVEIMMEVASSPAPYTHAGKRGSPAPFNWHVGVATNHTTSTETASAVAYNYMPSCAQEADAQQLFPNGNTNLEYGWSTDAAEASRPIGPVPTLLPDVQYLSDLKNPLQASVSPVGFVEEGFVNMGIAQDTNAQQDGDFEFAIPGRFGQMQHAGPLWDRPVANITDETAVPEITDMEAKLIDVLGLSVKDVTAPVDFVLPGQALPNGLAITQIDFPTDDLLPQILQDDETAQVSYSRITTTPAMGNVVATSADGQWLGPYHDVNAMSLITDSNPPLGNTFKNVDFLLYPGFGALEAPSTITNQQSHAVGLLPPTDDIHSVNSPSNGSIGHWDTPRTPARWDHSMSSSPNPIPYLTPDPQVGDFLPQVPFNGFSTDVSFPQPTLNDLMGNFDINVQPQLKKRKRKAFNAEDKKKVNQVRENGACVSCYARKIPCNVGGVCAGCLKTAGNPDLAYEICLRTKLKDVYKSVKDIHDTLDDRQRRLIPLLESLTGDPKSVDLTVENARLGYKFQLRLQVMKCTSSPSCRWKRLTKVNGIYVTRDVIQDQRYVIVPQSLPSIDEYDNFGRQILATSNGSHSGSLTQFLDEFLLSFCQQSEPSRLRQFANYTLRVASLSRLVAYGFLNLYDGSYDLLDRQTGEPITENSVSRRYVSETVHDQLRILAAEGLEPVERVVFAEIDNLHKLFGKVRNGRIVSGICVLRLMLLYRDRVVRDSIRLALPRSGERHRKRLAKAAFMYKRLTIAYGTLCRGTTPLVMGWEPENERDPTNEDLVMTQALSTLQPAFEDFCNEKLSSEYDDVFKGLIIEAAKIDRRPSKKRKAQKDQGEVVECHDC